MGSSVGRGIADASVCDKVNGCEDDAHQGITVTACCCNTDLCNGASPLQQQIVSLLIALIMCSILRYWRF